jgi:uncharacterized membrane protein
MFMYVGTYADQMTAEEDLTAIKELHIAGAVGAYDAGIVTKEADGKMKIERYTDSTGKGARKGLVVGAILGVIFPPSILVSAIAGAGAGALIGRHFNAISKDDMKAIGDFLENNETALVIIGESKVEEMVMKAIKKAVKKFKKEFYADIKEYHKELEALTHVSKM